MEAALDVLQQVQAVFFLTLGGIAFYRWYEHRGASRAWIAATFGDLAIITVVGRVLGNEPADPRSPKDFVVRALVVMIVLFPYFLFRFAATFRQRPRWLEVGALVLTVALGASVFLFRELPGEGESWSGAFSAFLVLFLVQWVALSAIVAWELWRSGRGQPTVSRRRMRLLSVGSMGLALALVVSGTAGGGGNSSQGSQLVVQLLALASAPLFLLGFAPPRFLLAAWRRPELEELRAAEEVLMRAVTPAEVGERLLPHVTRIIGGRASALVDADGDLLGVHGIDASAAGPLLEPHTGPGNGEVIAIPLRAGRLVVQATPYTPYFARSETELLDTLATFTDLALSRAELSERERQTAIELQAANEAMREFVAIASHDLRTPVTVIKGFATALESDADTIPAEQRQQFLGTIRRHADHLGVIIDDLLTTSRLDAGVVEPTPGDIVLAPFLERLCADLAPEEPVRVEVPDGLAVRCDVEHLQRMVTNYLVNAFRYGAPPVTVRARRRGDDVEVVVCDEGAGVPADFTARAFEKFARVDKRHSRETQGTGLGLAIVRGLARANGGDAWFTPNEPKGACFGIRVPAAGTP